MIYENMEQTDLYDVKALLQAQQAQLDKFSKNCQFSAIDNVAQTITSQNSGKNGGTPESYQYSRGK